MGDQANMRRFGALCGAEGIAWVDYDGLARHPRRSAILRLLVEGQDHRGRLRAHTSAGSEATWIGWIYSRRPAPALPRSLHAWPLLHDVPRQARWTEACPCSARVQAS